MWFEFAHWLTTIIARRWTCCSCERYRTIPNHESLNHHRGPNCPERLLSRTAACCSRAWFYARTHAIIAKQHFEISYLAPIAESYSETTHLTIRSGLRNNMFGKEDRHAETQKSDSRNVNLTKGSSGKNLTPETSI